jgi:hypothetical protein
MPIRTVGKPSLYVAGAAPAAARDELTEIRADELRFTVDEARELLAAAGLDLPAPALALLYEQTEGWATGLRLAALSLAGDPDPGQFTAAAEKYCVMPLPSVPAFPQAGGLGSSPVAGGRYWARTSDLPVVRSLVAVGEISPDRLPSPIYLHR